MKALSRGHVLINRSRRAIAHEIVEQRPVRKQNRFWIAIGMYAVLGILAGTTLDGRLRLVSLAILGLFAVRTYVHDRRQALEEKIENEQSRE
jgi:hypothetical protein